MPEHEELPKHRDSASTQQSIEDTLATLIETEHERIARGPTMAEWLDQMRALRIPRLTTEQMIEDIRELREGSNVLGPTSDDIVEALNETRRERDDHLYSRQAGPEDHHP